MYRLTLATLLIAAPSFLTCDKYSGPIYPTDTLAVYDTTRDTVYVMPSTGVCPICDPKPSLAGLSIRDSTPNPGRDSLAYYLQEDQYDTNGCDTSSIHLDFGPSVAGGLDDTLTGVKITWLWSCVSRSAFRAHYVLAPMIGWVLDSTSVTYYQVSSP